MHLWIFQFLNKCTLGKVLFGTPSGGVGLYVPESMLEDARNLLAPVEESTRNEEES